MKITLEIKEASELFEELKIDKTVKKEWEEELKTVNENDYQSIINFLKLFETATGDIEELNTHVKEFLDLDSAMYFKIYNRKWLNEN